MHTARNKARYLKALAKGMQPALAAARCHLRLLDSVRLEGGTTPSLPRRGRNAIELGLDQIEYDTYTSGLSSDRQFILKGRRKEVYGPQQDDTQRG